MSDKPNVLPPLSIHEGLAIARAISGLISAVSAEMQEDRSKAMDGLGKASEALDKLISEIEKKLTP